MGRKRHNQSIKDRQINFRSDPETDQMLHELAEEASATNSQILRSLIHFAYHNKNFISHILLANFAPGGRIFVDDQPQKAYETDTELE